MNFSWVKNKLRYQTGESLYLNGIRVGSFGWNAGRSQGDKDASTVWVGDIELPSLKDTSKRVFGSTEDDIRAKVELIVTAWFKKATGGVNNA